MDLFIIQDQRLTPPIEHWPEGDRSAFRAAVGTDRGPFQRSRSVRSPYTLIKVRNSYARYLRYLGDAGQLHPEERPCDRATPSRLDGYLKHLQDRGNADRTVWGYFEGLRTALRMMYPAHDFRWILKPQGVPLSRVLPMRTKTIIPIDSAVLLTWAEELFKEGMSTRTSARRCCRVRNAAILGLLAERVPRLRALSLLRLGDSLKRSEQGWLLREHAEMMKMRNPHYMPVSPRVGRMLDRYVEFERRELLGSRHKSSAAWVKSGGDLSAAGLQSIVAHAFLRRFGERHGPHFFRHCLKTTLADQLPGHPLDGAVMLAHAPATNIMTYNHTKKVCCARRLDALLKQLRPGFVPPSRSKRSGGKAVAVDVMS